MLASLSKGCSSLVPPSTVFPPISPPVIFLFLPPLLLRIGLYLFFDEVHVRRREMYSQTALDRIPIPVGNSRSVSVVTESKLVLNFLHSSVPRAPYNTYLTCFLVPFLFVISSLSRLFQSSPRSRLEYQDYGFESDSSFLEYR